ncbi:hypothetical protein BDB01DRAFT_840179 [Pilobolus umbonatus]|nr:hypothetical protein BDB01DRAFT_840179 [Pilobolus umbonatus]
MTQLKPPTVNTNRKGRKAKRSVKSGVERMTIAREMFEEEQKKEIERRKVEEKRQEELGKKRKLVEDEQLDQEIEKKKIRLTVFVKGEDGSTYPEKKKTDVVEATENNGTYTNANKDVPFQWIEGTFRKTIKAIHSMSGDGNCGFRAVAFEVYKDEDYWYKVKQKMKNTYLKYKDTLYKGVETEMENKVEEDIMMNKLDSFKSPCLGNDDLPLWFSTFTCPQVVADTYQRPVILYCYLENFVNGEIRRFYESQVFFLLIEMEMFKTEYPISLLLSHTHIALIISVLQQGA